MGSHPVDLTSYQELSWLIGLRAVGGSMAACAEAERAIDRDFADEQIAENGGELNALA